MNIQKRILLVILLSLGIIVETNAAERYRVVIKGTTQSTSPSGAIVTKPFSSATMVKDCLGATNGFVLVYTLNATDISDELQVINTANGEVFCTPFQLYPPTVYGNFDGNFTKVVNNNETEVRQIRYFFGRQSNHGVGTVYLTVKTLAGKKGQSPKTSITGEFRFFVLPEGTNSLKICFGTLTASQKYNP